MVSAERFYPEIRNNIEVSGGVEVIIQDFNLTPILDSVSHDEEPRSDNLDADDDDNDYG